MTDTSFEHVHWIHYAELIAILYPLIRNGTARAVTLYVSLVIGMQLSTVEELFPRVPLMILHLH